MEKKIFRVLALRVDLNNLPNEVIDVLEEFVSNLGFVLQVERTDPVSAADHLRQCQRLDEKGVPVAGVWLADQPLPSLAMDAGIPHFVVTPKGVMKVKVHVEFVPATGEDFEYDH